MKRDKALIATQRERRSAASTKFELLLLHAEHLADFLAIDLRQARENRCFRISQLSGLPKKAQKRFEDVVQGLAVSYVMLRRDIEERNAVVE